MRALILSTICLTGLLAVSCSNRKDQASAPITSDVLVSSTESWDGKGFSYPQGKAEMTLIRAVFPPGAKTPVHTHPQPGVVYVEKGWIKCTLTESGRRREFRRGEAFVASTGDTQHACENIGNEDAVVFVAWAGVEGVPRRQPLKAE